MGSGLLVCLGSPPDKGGIGIWVETPSFGGGGGGVAFAFGVKSSSLLFSSLSFHISSNARFGDALVRFRVGREGIGDVVDTNDGGSDSEAGTSSEVGEGWYVDEGDAYCWEREGDDERGRISSLLKRAVSKRVSPGAAGGSANGRGRWCRAPKPSIQPRAPSPPQFREGVIVTSLVTVYS